MQIIEEFNKVSSAEPKSLDQERSINTFLAGTGTSPDTIEGNLLSIITLQKIYGEQDPSLRAVAVEETKYLKRAIDVLHGTPNGEAPLRIQAKLRDKFGTDLLAGVRLAKVLKNKADDIAADKLLSQASSTLLPNDIAPIPAFR
jgi:hypothetical protein